MTRTEWFIVAPLALLMILGVESAWATAIQVFDEKFREYHLMYLDELEIRRWNGSEYTIGRWVKKETQRVQRPRR